MAHIRVRPKLKRPKFIKRKSNPVKRNKTSPLKKQTTGKKQPIGNKTANRGKKPNHTIAKHNHGVKHPTPHHVPSVVPHTNPIPSLGHPSVSHDSKTPVNVKRKPLPPIPKDHPKKTQPSVHHRDDKPQDHSIKPSPVHKAKEHHHEPDKKTNHITHVDNKHGATTSQKQDGKHNEPHSEPKNSHTQRSGEHDAKPNHEAQSGKKHNQDVQPKPTQKAQDKTPNQEAQPEKKQDLNQQQPTDQQDKVQQPQQTTPQQQQQQPQQQPNPQQDSGLQQQQPNPQQDSGLQQQSGSQSTPVQPKQFTPIIPESLMDNYIESPYQDEIIRKHPSWFKGNKYNEGEFTRRIRAVGIEFPTVDTKTISVGMVSPIIPQ